MSRPHPPPPDPSVARAADTVALRELMSRYSRLVDGLRFDELPDVLTDDVVVAYAWLPPGGDTHERTELRGVGEVAAWLRSRLEGRPDLRRYMTGFELVRLAPPLATVRQQMHERDMRITGHYELDARKAGGTWRVSALRLEEEILWA